MGKLIYVTGGARSGKSSFAENIARQYEKVVYIATAMRTDSEMEDRIRRHRASRPSAWRTIEAYKALEQELLKVTEDAVLIDCLTVMTTNLMFDCPFDHNQLSLDDIENMEQFVQKEIQNLLAGVKISSADVIVVSNEVGMGLVPEYALSRAFRDIAGRVNQTVAAAADEAWFLVSGLPLRLK